jgi:DNA-binding GntR family transcriptional regulator
VSTADATDIFDLRLLIEPACAAAAARADDTSELEAFRDPADQDFVAYNREFHAALADLSGNTRMAAVAKDLVEQSDRLVRVSVATLRLADRRHLITEHNAIIDAIRAGDGEQAARIIRDHVAEARARVLLALETIEYRENEI